MICECFCYLFILDMPDPKRISAAAIVTTTFDQVAVMLGSQVNTIISIAIMPAQQ